MKKIILLLMVSLAFIGCSSDNDPETIEAKSFYARTYQDSRIGSLSSVSLYSFYYDLKGTLKEIYGYSFKPTTGLPLPKNQWQNIIDRANREVDPSIAISVDDFIEIYPFEDSIYLLVIREGE